MRSIDVVTQPVTASLDLPVFDSDLDDQHPWPGLEGYQEGDKKFFKGRSKEVEELYSHVRRERLTLLFGKAGTGKSSLVRAGLFPKQRAEEALPVHVRLDYSNDASPPGEQVKAAIYAAAQVAKFEAPEPSEADSLWEYLHLREGEFWSPSHRIIMPFIVLDQFEEMFTHGLVQKDEQRVAKLKSFLSELSDLAEDRVPLDLATDKDRLARYYPGRHHYKLLACIREEHLAELDRMQAILPPALFHNRMRLADLTADKAREVVEQTGEAVGADEVADEIVEKASEATQEQSRQTELGVPKSRVHPALLTVLCVMANKKRLEEGAAKIARSYIEDVGKDILTDFYERQLRTLPPIPGERPWHFQSTRSRRVNDRIAEEFVDGDVRVAMPESHARTVFGDAALEQLVRDKVLGYDEQGRVELIHDVLSPTVKESKSRFLAQLARAARDLAVALAIAILVLTPAAAVIGFDWGQRQAEPGLDSTGQPELPSVSPPVTPDGPEDGINLVTRLLDDLNQGTRMIDATVSSLEDGELVEARASLALLAVFLKRARPSFCGFVAELESWRRAQVQRIVGEACSAVGIQGAQFGTLSELVRDLEEQGDQILFSDAVRDSVVRQWSAYETDFNESASIINTVRDAWVAEFGR